MRLLQNAAILLGFVSKATEDTLGLGTLRAVGVQAGREAGGGWGGKGTRGGEIQPQCMLGRG